VRSVAVKLRAVLRAVLSPPVFGFVGLGLIVAGIGMVLGTGFGLIGAGAALVWVGIDWQAGK
jgi:hypothetical protein